jgi:hypothetical protein
MRPGVGRKAAFSIIAAAGVLVVAGAAASCTIKNADHPLVQAYLGAEPVTPAWNPDIHPAEPMWNRQIDLGRTAVTVAARCCVGGRFVAQYSDESTPRVMFTPGDYVYPTELRVASRGHVLYGRASGLAGGITETTKIFSYDFDARRLVEAVEVAPRLLPPVKAPPSPRP